MKKYSISALIFSALLSAEVQAKTITVLPPDSIQSAIDAAIPGDIISIGPGDYEEALVITTDRLTLSGSGNVQISSPLADELTGDSALRIENASDVVVENLRFTSSAGGQQTVGYYILGAYSLPAIRLSAADATLRDVTAECEGPQEFEGLPSAALSATDSFLNLEECTLQGANGTWVPSGEPGPPMPTTKRTPGGVGIAVSGGTLAARGCTIRGGRGGGQLPGSSPYSGPLGVAGGPAVVASQGVFFDFRDGTLIAGETPEPTFLPPYWIIGSSEPAMPILRLSEGAKGLIANNTLTVALTYVRAVQYYPSRYVSEDGEVVASTSDTLLVDSETRRFAEVATILRLRPPTPAALPGPDGIFDAADLLTTGEVALPFPWWE